MHPFPHEPNSRLPATPERRRILVIGAGPTGMSAAFHLGEHCLLLERRDSLEDSHDCSHDFPLGSAYGGGLGDEDPDPDGYGPPVSADEKKALFISCSSGASAGKSEHTLIHIERWRPPNLAAPKPATASLMPPSVRTLRPLLRGELRLNSLVVRVAPEAHLLELANGHRIIYDKLVSTLPLYITELLATRDLPAHVRRDETLRYWLSEHDIEVADRTTQDFYGDLDDFAAGKRIAEHLGHSLALKFGGAGHPKPSRTHLFQPRLVRPQVRTPAGA
jgi:hypothetical protein